MKRTTRSSVPLFSFLLAALLVGKAGFIQAADGPALIGNKACGDCHAEVAVGFAATLHARAFSAGGRYAAAGCESCHGPGGTHQQDRTRETIVSFTPKAGRSAEQLSAQCLGCHAASAAVAFWDVGKHRKNDVTCTACHAIHASASPLPRQPDACFGCHRDVRFDVSKRSHHPIAEGKVSCSDCHNPHGTLTPRLLKADSLNELCYGCHAEKRGPFVWEHAPVEESCVNCHTPHGSRQAKLLVKKVPNLCQECHDWSRHPGTAYDGRTAFTGAAPSNRSYARSCLNCHNAIHGSWAPVNPNNGENAGNKWMR